MVCFKVTIPYIILQFQFTGEQRKTLAECLEEGLKLTLADVQTLLLDISLAVNDMQDNGVADIVVKEETILVEPPQVGTVTNFCTNERFDIYISQYQLKCSSRLFTFQHLEDKMRFSIQLPKKENGRASVCSTQAEIGALGDGNAGHTSGEDDLIDQDEHLANLVSRLLKRFKPLSIK